LVLAAAIFAVVTLLVVLVMRSSQWLTEDVCRTEHLWGVIRCERKRGAKRPGVCVSGVVDNNGRDGGLSDQMAGMREFVIVSTTG
jgi:hypothetical protein